MNESYYNDLYDLFTIQECLRISKVCDNKIEVKTIGVYDTKEVKTYLKDIQLYFVKGERYRRKASTISEWRENDRRRDQKLEQTPPPRNISCPQCLQPMSVIFKDLYDSNIDSLRVLFFFECPICKKRKGAFEDGKEWVSKYRDVKLDDPDLNDRKWKAEQEKDRELLLKYRSEFCLSDDEGQEYIESQRRLESLAYIITETERKKSDPDYEKVAQLKRIGIVELEKLLTEELVPQKYIKLVLDKPEIDRYVVVPFTVQDEESTRKENDSVYTLQRLIKKVLERTNWRLMSAGVSYRLGYLSGRLKGYEREEDLIKIIKKQKE